MTCPFGRPNHNRAFANLWFADPLGDCVTNTIMYKNMPPIPPIGDFVATYGLELYIKDMRSEGLTFPLGSPLPLWAGTKSLSLAMLHFLEGS
jgi:hypothetical protein